MIDALLLGLAGGAGAVSRFLIAGRFAKPYGTLVVNVTGAFILGLLGENLILGTGFVGAYTTFSTWMLETHQLSRRAAVLNVAVSLVLGLAAAGLGMALRKAG